MFMKLTKHAAESWCKLVNKKYKCYFTLVERQIGGKTANNVTFPDLQYTKINSQMLTKESAKIIGEMFIKISELL